MCVFSRENSLSCISDKEINTIKLEFALINNNLKQLIYVSLFLLYFDSGGRNHSINIEVISPDRMITCVIKNFYFELNVLEALPSRELRESYVS